MADMKKIVVLLFVLLTSSCSLSIVYPPATIKDLLPVGSTLQLTLPLNIPAQRSYIYIANGKVAPLKNYNTVDVYEPYCMFGFDKESSQPRQIMPDNFEVTRVIERDDYIASLNYKKIAPGYNRKVGLVNAVNFSGEDAGPGIVMSATIIDLYSDKQSDVKKMTCGHWDEPHIVEPLTLKELKTALGKLILINENRLDRL